MLGRARDSLLGTLCLMAAASFCAGCVTVYEPLSSLSRPVVIDPRLPNFEGMKLLVRCVPGEALSNGEANKLCAEVSTLFRNQGALVESEVPKPGGAGRAEEEVKGDLVLELRTRLLHEEDSMLLRIFSALTLTAVPTYNEQSFAQDVVIKDPGGSLLASDSFQERFIEYDGAGIWGVNWILDVTVRPDDQELTGDVAKRDFSRDFYGQLSQLVLNARVRSQVLKGFPAKVDTQKLGEK